MSSREFAEWLAYFELEPFGEERADLRSGIVASTIANVNRDPKRRRRAFRPEDFMPRFGPRERKRSSWQEQLSLVEMLNAAHRGRDERTKS
jgi:hypothetical protein